jgi:hypothetical protein
MVAIASPHRSPDNRYCHRAEYTTAHASGCFDLDWIFLIQIAQVRQSRNDGIQRIVVKIHFRIERNHVADPLYQTPGD